MVKEGIGRIIRIGRGNTRYITIPALVTKDENFPFEDDEIVRVKIKDKKLIIEKIE